MYLVGPRINRQPVAQIEDTYVHKALKHLYFGPCIHFVQILINCEYMAQRYTTLDVCA